MIYLKRGSAPEFWTRERVKTWTGRWLVKREKGGDWSWPQVDKQPLNQHARLNMAEWQFGKCAFCETPIGSRAEVEHFHSKAHYPLAAFVWRNLFLACHDCNHAKGEADHAGCIKPDRENPADYLWVNPYSLKVEPKPGISEKARRRAVKTIKTYQLDRPELKRLYQLTYLKGETLNLVPPLIQARQNQPSTDPTIEDRISVLRARAEPEQPFSLFVRSFLVHYGVIEK
ncbi:retron system putative HNH endonuclease [Anaerolineales bacterium HSG6]|nr:retron system putative HNH endonuclease [Anaerolineales bacterium HSG6]